MKYAVLSDIHAHAWSLFATTNTDGVNSRLRIVLDEIERAAKMLLAEGGKDMIIAGDIFHTRGTIDPEVLNPVRQTLEKIRKSGITIFIIPGNHDLKSADTKELSSAVQNLQIRSDTANIGEIHVINQPIVHFGFAFVPWRANNELLLKDIAELSKGALSKTRDLFIHAGIDGVLSGVPGSGLTSDVLADYGFRRVFAGHYHNHKDMSRGVYSIGATTHHNWGDVGTRAGFLMVEESTSEVTFHDSKAPKFVDVTGLDEFEMELECMGNYVRYRGPAMTQSQINEFRQALKDWGALGVSIEVPRLVVSARTTAPATGLTLDQSVDSFIDSASSIPAHLDRAFLKKRAAEILLNTRAVIDEA